jgi:hypothetical protein
VHALTEGRRPFDRPGIRWKNIDTVVKETGCGNVEGIILAQDTIQRRDYVKNEMGIKRVQLNVRHSWNSSTTASFSTWNPFVNSLIRA